MTAFQESANSAGQPPICHHVGLTPSVSKRAATSRQCFGFVVESVAEIGYAHNCAEDVCLRQRGSVALQKFNEVWAALIHFSTNVRRNALMEVP